MGLFSKPKQPDYAKAAQDNVYADLSTSPFTYLINAVSKTGGKITLDGKTYDFTGLGDADTTRQTSDQMAAALLEMQRKYGAQYVQQRLAELQASDPDGQAARKQLYEATMASLNAPPDEQALVLERLVQGDLESDRILTPGTERDVTQGVRNQQTARGNVLGNAATAQESRAVVQAGDAQAEQRQQTALSYLMSGTSPEDIEYRRVQQGMGNLANFINGNTPTAEFAGLTSAGNGAAPFMGGGQNPYTVNPNAGIQGAQNKQQIFSTQSSYDRTQANPWLAGAQIGIGAVQAYQAATPRVGGAIGQPTYTAPTWAGAANQWD